MTICHYIILLENNKICRRHRFSYLEASSSTRVASFCSILEENRLLDDEPDDGRDKFIISS